MNDELWCCLDGLSLSLLICLSVQLLACLLMMQVKPQQWLLWPRGE